MTLKFDLQSWGITVCFKQTWLHTLIWEEIPVHLFLLPVRWQRFTVPVSIKELCLWNTQGISLTYILPYLKSLVEERPLERSPALLHRQEISQLEHSNKNAEYLYGNTLETRYQFESTKSHYPLHAERWLKKPKIRGNLFHRLLTWLKTMSTVFNLL